MTPEEELERYHKLLEDWRPGPAAPRMPTSRAPQQNPFVSSPKPPVGGNFGVEPLRPTAHALASGSILLLQERTLAIYHRHVPEKEYHLVLVLNPNGSVKLQGIALEAHQSEEVGKLPQQYLDQLQNEMRWDRDLIVFHCYRYEDARRIPLQLGGQTPATAQPASERVTSSTAPADVRAAAEPATAASTRPYSPTRRGQRVQIKFGNNLWDAVYWGRDAQGHVIAHQTHHKWTLMHLDLDRFSNGLLVDPHVDEALLQEIEHSMLEGTD